MNGTASKGRLGRRLSRILVMVPYAIQHPGVTTDELAHKFGVKKKDLIEDLRLLFLCGLPGYGPGDLIDVSFDGDQVYVRMADYFAAPLRMTPAEALALYAGGEAIAALPGMDQADALRRALAKLRRALGSGAGTASAGLDVKLESAPEEHLRALQQALDRRKQVLLEYFSARRGEMTSRTVHPWALMTALGRWYLVGFDELAGEERMFRADRIKTVAVTDDDAEIPRDFDASHYRRAFSRRDGGADEFVLTLEISPGAARWFGEYYPLQASHTLPDGWESVELSASGLHWAAMLVLRLGREVRAVEPGAVAAAAHELAEKIAARYRGEST